MRNIITYKIYDIKSNAKYKWFKKHPKSLDTKDKIVKSISDMQPIDREKLINESPCKELLQSSNDDMIRIRKNLLKLALKSNIINEYLSVFTLEEVMELMPNSQDDNTLFEHENLKNAIESYLLNKCDRREKIFILRNISDTLKSVNNKLISLKKI